MAALRIHGEAIMRAARFLLIRTSGNSLFLEAHIRTLVVSLMGIAALTAGLVLIRQQQQVGMPRVKEVPPGENLPGRISLERLRELGY
jgi:hypothetical protein